MIRGFDNPNARKERLLTQIRGLRTLKRSKDTRSSSARGQNQGLRVKEKGLWMRLRHSRYESRPNSPKNEANKASDATQSASMQSGTFWVAGLLSFVIDNMQKYTINAF